MLRKYRIQIVFGLIILILIISFILVRFNMLEGKKNYVINNSSNYINEMHDNKNVGELKNKIFVYNNNISYVNFPLLNNDILNNSINNIIELLVHDNKYTQYLDYEIYEGYNNTTSLVYYETLVYNDSVLENNIYTYNLLDTTGDNVKSTYFFNANYVDRLGLESIDKYILTNDQLIVFDEPGHVYSLNEILSYLNDLDVTDLKNDTTYYVKEDINCYESNNLNSNVNKIIEVGNEVKVTFNDDLLQLTDMGCYVLPNYLTEDIVLTSNYTPVSKTYYAVLEVNVYGSETVDENILGSFKKNSAIKVIGESDEWFLINYNNKKGYIEKEKLTSVKPTTTTTTKKTTVVKNTVKITAPAQGNLDGSKKMVAFTFDDGPNTTSTVRIINTLNKYNVHATFFDIGNLAKKRPNVVKMEAAAGEVGCHSYTHPNLNKLSTKEVKEEISKCETVFDEILGYRFTYVRPPYGSANANVQAAIDYPLINWNVDTLDWKSRNKDKIIAKVKEVKNLDGKVVLFHSIYGSTADAIEYLVPYLINEGYQIVDISELAYYKGKTLKTHTVYWGI